MSIKANVQEIKIIKKEIKRNNATNRNLRKRLKVLELEVDKYITSRNQSGIKHKGTAIRIINTERRPPKKKQQKKDDLMELLYDLGVKDVEKAYTRLIETQKGDPVPHRKLDFKKIKKPK